MISPFLDPATRVKIAMLRSPANVKDSIPLDMLDSDFGGTWKYEFNFDKYWSTLIDFCGIAPDGTRTHSTKARPTKEVDSVQDDVVKTEEKTAEDQTPATKSEEEGI